MRAADAGRRRRRVVAVGRPADVVGRQPRRRAGGRRRGRRGGRGSTRWWSPSACCGTATSRGRRRRWRRSGVDHDPTRAEGVRSLADRDAPRRLVAGRGGRAAQRAGHRPARRHRRGARGGVPRRLGARRHVPRAARARDGSDGVELWIEAFLGGAVLQPGERRELHAVWFADGERRSVAAARGLGRPSSAAPAHARTGAPYQVGWCSWYHYFHARHRGGPARRTWRTAADWPFDVFQLDDGFQPAIGDWLTTNDKFPSTLDELAARRSPPRGARRASGSPRSSPAPTPPSRPRTPSGSPPTCASGHAARRHGQRRLGRRGAHARHDPARGARPPRGRRSVARRRRVPLPEARLHLRAVDPRRLRRPQPHAGPARPRRLRRHPARRRRRRVPPRVRRADRARRRGRRRHAHRRRRGAVVAPAARPVPAARAHRRRAGHGERVAQHAEPVVPAPPAVAQRPRLPDAPHRPHRRSSPSRCGRGRSPSA